MKYTTMIARWESTGLLKDVPEESKYAVALLFEKCKIWLLENDYTNAHEKSPDAFILMNMFASIRFIWGLCQCKSIKYGALAKIMKEVHKFYENKVIVSYSSVDMDAESVMAISYKYVERYHGSSLKIPSHFK